MLCIRVKQEDPNGNLDTDWRAFAPAGFDSPEDASCKAELADARGSTLPMAANYAAISNCYVLRSETDLTPAPIRAVRWLVGAVSLGHAHLNIGNSVKYTQYEPRNGQWLYAFSTKNRSTFRRIRITYVLPPKPRDLVMVRFEKVPI
jgi:hypothetical protein